MRAFAAILALVIPLVASAASDQAETADRYIVVLQKAGTAKPVGDEVKALGGTVEAVLRDRLVMSAPATAIEALRGVYGVRSIQPFVSQALATELRIVEQQIALPEPVVSDTSMTWRSGEYTYDGAGNIVTIGTSVAPGTQGYRTYGYDALSRLTSAQIGGVAPAATYGYAYDVYGNRTGSTMNQQAMATLDVDAATNRLTGAGYGYDASGNQMVNGTSVATWDAFAMMTSYRFGDTPSNTNTYVYTASDERIGVLRGSEWTWTLRGPDGKPLRQYLSSTSANAPWFWVEDFVYRDGALLVSERAAAEGGLRHYHLDHLGSARLITGAAGSLLSEHDFLPFGGERTEIDQHTSLGFSREEPLRYTGHERDFENAEPNDSSAYIDYMHARYYGPGTGRFLSVDPHLNLERALVSLQAWNRYSYVENNPLNAIDPDGRDTYRINRRIGSHEVRSPWNPLTHTFIATTTGGVIRTYSWGNTPDQFTENGWNADKPEDLVAAWEAIRQGLATKIGDSALDPYVKQAFDALKIDPNSAHWNLGLLLNCKFEALVLIKMAREIKRQNDAMQQKQPTPKKPAPNPSKPPSTQPGPKHPKNPAPCPGSPGCP